MPRLIDSMMRDISAGYLRDRDRLASDGTLDLADPLIALERGPALDRALPPFFAAVDTRDPLLDDTRRLQKALTALNVPCEARYYPGGVHAFHALVWDPTARRCWRDALAFLERHTRRPRGRYADGALSQAS
jgi:acetyl esterase/lipase